MFKPVDVIAVVFAIAYLALATRQSRWCWPAALVSVTFFAISFFESRLYMQSALQVYYFGMAIYGWMAWQRGGERHTGVEVHWWPPKLHLVVLASIVAVSGILGWALSRTDAVFPFLDSFSTVAALVATFMVTRKVIENWIYWFIIDSVLVYIFWQSDSLWFVGLYALYLLMIVAGFVSWLNSSRSGSSEGDQSNAV